MGKGLAATTIGQLKPKQRNGKPMRTEFADGRAGLYLVVQPSGAKSWVMRFRSPTDRSNRDGKRIKKGQRKAKKLTLGPLSLGNSKAPPQIGHPLTLAQARALAATSLEQVKRDIDPTATRREEKAAAKGEAVSDSTVDAAVVEFLARYKGKKRQGIRESTRLLTAHYFGLRPDTDKPGQWKKTGNGVLAAWSGRPLASITKHDAITLLDKLVDAKHGVTANRTLTNLKVFFGWCVKRDMLATSPVAVLDAVAQEHSRERKLSDAELKALFKAADTEKYPFGSLTQLLLLTGARRDELRKAKWAEFDLDARTWLLPAARSKNGREHLVPLAPLAVEILQNLPRIAKSQLLFTTNGINPVSGLSKAKSRLDDAMRAELNGNLDSWSPHDLRRTFYSGLQALGFSIEVAEACVNHKSGTLRGVAAVYGRHSYVAEKTSAFEAWARHVGAVVNGSAGASVVPLHGGRQ